MSMSKGCLRRAFSCAFFFFVLCVYPGFGQPAPQAARKRQVKITAPRFVPNRYIVFLQDPPVSARYAGRDRMATSEALAYQSQIVSRQQSLMTELASRNIRVTGSVNTLLNAVFVATTPDRLAEIRALSGVIGVMPERAMKKALNKATALANAPAAWNLVGGQSNAGAGMKIAILDTGIDQTHPAFQDSTLPKLTGFPKCNVQSDCTNFTNNKVIVARSYVPQIAAQSLTAAPNPATSSPDDYSARDRDGHGTAVASTAAAWQNSGGAIAFSGMAPKAYLGNYKIYGTDGVNDYPPESVWIQAIEDALKDGMDVANLSSGGPAYTGALDTTACGNPAGVPCDPLASAFDAASKAGLVITVSAGNAGDDFYYSFGVYPYYSSIESPSTAPSVISVGATLNEHALGALVSVLASNAPASLQTISAQRSDGCFGWDPQTADCTLGPVSVSPSLSAPLVDVTKLDPTGLACSALPASSLNGKFALIQRGTCSFDIKSVNATNAGAAGVILYMADSSAAFAPEILDVTNVFVPVVMISLSDGQALKSYIDANPNAPVRIDTAGMEQSVSSVSSASANQLVSWSSLGPTPDGMIKPDLVATGGFDYSLGQIDPNSPYSPSYNGMYLATQSYDQSSGLYSATGYIGADGTSFSSPLVAGAAALVKQAHPAWTPAQIKSALLNYAAQDVTTDDFTDPVDVQWIGAGRLDANAAVSATVTAVPSTLSFGFLKSGVALPSPIPVTVTNAGSTSVTLAAAVVVGVAGATVSVSPSSITLAAGATSTLTVTLSGAVPAAGEYNGAVTLKSSTVSMRIPYMFIVGDGVPLNVLPLYGCCYGAVGTDLGANPIQITDQYGVPVAGASVSWTVSPAGAVTLKSVTGVPGTTTNTAEPFPPLACSPASSTRALACPTNNYGISWVEVVGGPSATTTATITASSPPDTGVNVILFGVDLIPVPSILAGGVANAGSYQSTLAPGSYASIFGANLMDPNYIINTAAGGDASFFSRMPLSLDDVSVSFDAPATGSLPAISEPGYVYFVSPGQVNVFVPWELENYASAQVKVTFVESMYSNLVSVALNNYTPAFLMNSGTVADAVDNSTGAIITTSNPATAGEYLQLYCNGLGPVANQPASGDPASLTVLSQTTTPATVTIGGKPVTPLFAGLAPGSVGEYEVVIQVPSGLTSGNQPITVSVGGVTSPASVAGLPVYLPIK
ncbi:MAG: S8 family serine peptidase [Bryobacteraceae bacterium]